MMGIADPKEFPSGPVQHALHPYRGYSSSTCHLYSELDLFSVCELPAFMSLGAIRLLYSAWCLGSF